MTLGEIAYIIVSFIVVFFLAQAGARLIFFQQTREATFRDIGCVIALTAVLIILGAAMPHFLPPVLH